jgi:acyl-CoA dehydrogenase
MLPTDALGHDVAQSLQSPEAARDRLTSSIYRPTDLSDALGRLEQAFALSVKADKILKHIKTTIQFHNQSHQDLAQQLTIALEAGLITQDELELIHQAASARNDVIQVDAFTLNEYQAGRQRCSLPNSMMSRSDLVIR